MGGKDDLAGSAMGQLKYRMYGFKMFLLESTFQKTKLNPKPEQSLFYTATISVSFGTSLLVTGAASI